MKSKVCIIEKNDREFHLKGPITRESHFVMTLHTDRETDITGGIGHIK